MLAYMNQETVNLRSFDRLKKESTKARELISRNGFILDRKYWFLKTTLQFCRSLPLLRVQLDATPFLGHGRNGHSRETKSFATPLSVHGFSNSPF